MRWFPSLKSSVGRTDVMHAAAARSAAPAAVVGAALGPGGPDGGVWDVMGGVCPRSLWTRSVAQPVPAGRAGRPGGTGRRGHGHGARGAQPGLVSRGVEPLLSRTARYASYVQRDDGHGTVCCVVAHGAGTWWRRKNRER